MNDEYNSMDEKNNNNGAYTTFGGYTAQPGEAPAMTPEETAATTVPAADTPTASVPAEPQDIHNPETTIDLSAEKPETTTDLSAEKPETTTGLSAEKPETAAAEPQQDNLGVAGVVRETQPSRRQRRPSNMGKAAAAFIVIVSVAGGGFGLGFGTGVGMMAGREKEAVAATAPLEEAAATSVILAPADGRAQSAVLDPDETTVADVYKKMRSAVVSINVKGSQLGFFNQVYETEGAGSGIIFKEDEESVYIVTNYHVVTQSDEITISLDDAVQVGASPVGGSESDDIAVISVKKSDMIAAGITEYAIATFADSATIEIGDTAIAIGNALGEGKSATAGIISAIDKQIPTENQILTMLQTDAAINPGNSGGALVNAGGQVIGINTAKYMAGEGMGYAIPSNKVIEIIDNIIGESNVETPWLGIEPQPITEEIRDMYNLPSLGLYINNVLEGSSAEDAGLKTGDIITDVNGQPVRTYEALSDIIKASKVGDKMTLTVIRNGRGTLTVEVTLKKLELKF